MIAVLKHDAEKFGLEALTCRLTEAGFKTDIALSGDKHILCISGDTPALDTSYVESFACVESVKRITEPYKLCSRVYKPQDSVVKVGKASFGSRSFSVIAGPCAVESEEQLSEIAEKLCLSGAAVLRAGAFKPRTSPYSFQGLGARGLEILQKVGEKFGLPVVSEITSPEQLPLFDGIDMIQVGARNMQNYELLKLLGKCGKPVLLKRGIGATLTELLMSAEYILSGGNEDVILCERGIRTFETSARSTLDISAVPLLHKMTHLPVIVDPSHASGAASLISPLSLASCAAGADGLMIEVHSDPCSSKSDGAQAITPEQFDALNKKLRTMRSCL